MALLIQICITETVRTMTLGFWTVYIPSSRNLRLLHKIHQQFTVGTPLVMVLVGLTLQRKWSRRRIIVICQWFHYLTSATCCQMWCHPQWRQPMSSCKAGADSMFCSCAGWCDGRSCSLRFSWRENYSCDQDQSWFWMDLVFWLFASPPRDSGWHCVLQVVPAK